MSALLVALAPGRPALGAPTWTAVGSMASPREAHVAVLLPDGRVLVATGFANGGFLAGAELYDPASQSWSGAGSLSSGARALPSAILLSTGQALVAGGAVAGSPLGALSSAELFDPTSPGWTAAASLPAGRYRSIAVMLHTGRVLVAGGAGASGLAVRDADLYDPATGRWAAAAPMLGNRDQHTLTVLPSGQVLAVGGFGDGLGPMVELFDPVAGTWTATGPLSGPRSFHAAAVLPSGKVLVAGGFDSVRSAASAELYDPAAGTWTPTGSLATSRSTHTLTLLPSGKVLAAGGQSGTPSSFVALASTELYDPATGTWSPGPTMGTARYAHTATLLPSGRLLVAGGDGVGDIDVASVEELDEGPSTSLAVPLIATAPTAVAAAGGTLHVTGSGFVGASEGSGGNVQAAVSHFPLLELRPAVGGTPSYGALSAFDATSATAAVPADLAPGTYQLRIVVSGVPSAASALTVQAALAISPASRNLLAGASQAFTATGGSGTGYTWSLTASPSAGSIGAATGLYIAGSAVAAGGVTDVVRVVDSSGNTATASVLVVPAVAITPATVSAQAGSSQYFTASGGSGTGFTWSLATNASGGSIGPQSGAYAAGSAAGVDLVRVADSLGFTATATVTVTAAPPPVGGKGGGCGCATGEGGTSLLLALALLLARRRGEPGGRRPHAHG